MASNPFQNMFTEDRQNFNDWQGQLGNAVTDAQNQSGMLSAMYPSQDQYDRAVVTRMMQQGGAYQHLNPRYIDFLISEAPKMGMLQDMEALSTGGTGNTANTSLPRAQDFPEFVKNWVGGFQNGNKTSGQYGYGGFDANGMANIWNQFVGKYNQVVTNNQYTDPMVWGYLTGLSNSDLYNLQRFMTQGVYGAPANAAMDNYLKNAYSGFDQSTLGWTQFLNQIMGNNGKVG